jgi:stress response protein YsnF
MPDDDRTIYLVEEHAVVSKRLTATDGIRVHKLTHTDDVVVPTSTASEVIDVTRVPIDRWIDAPVPERQEGDTRIITLHAEVVVTATRLKATEEIRITRRRDTRDASERVTLRREEAVVERIPAGASGTEDKSRAVADGHAGPPTTKHGA